MLPPLFWPNEANRKDALLLGAPGVEPEGGPDGTDSRRVCRCRFVADACLVRGLCVGLPRDRTRLQRIRPRLRHHRRQAFRVAAMRAPQPAAGASRKSASTPPSRCPQRLKGCTHKGGHWANVRSRDVKGPKPDMAVMDISSV